MNNSGVLRMAVVGCGYFGEKHADIIGQLSNAELVAVCDKNWEAAKRLAQRTSCKAYEDIEEMLAKHGKISMFHYMGVHDFEAMLTFAEPARPVKAYAQWVGKKNVPYNGKDTVFNTITFDNGIVACIQLCWALPEGSLDFVACAEVVGTKGASYIDVKDQGLSIYREEAPVEYPELTYWPEYYGHVHGKLREEISHFVKNTLSGEPYAVSTERAVEAVRTIDACFESLKTGMPVTIER